MSLPSRIFNPGPQISSSFDWRVLLSSLHFSEQEAQGKVDVIRSRWWMLGPITERLEAEFSECIGVHHVNAVANRTAALHPALLAFFRSKGYGRNRAAHMNFASVSGCDT
jgi:hypothetical protein